MINGLPPRSPQPAPPPPPCAVPHTTWHQYNETLSATYNADLRAWLSFNNIPYEFKASNTAVDEYSAALYTYANHETGWLMVGLGVGPTAKEAEEMAWICAGANFEVELGEDELKRKKTKMKSPARGGGFMLGMHGNVLPKSGSRVAGALCFVYQRPT